METNCPICGRPFSPLDVVLTEHDVGYQCRNCWSRVRSTGNGAAALRGHRSKPAWAEAGSERFKAREQT